MRRGLLSILGCAVLGLTWAGGAAAWSRLVDSPVLQVRRIHTTGLVRTSEQEVWAYAGVHTGAAMMRLDLDAMALRLRQHPWIRAASIRRKLPDALHLSIDEHKPVLLVSLGELYLANAQGQLFKRFEARDTVDVPVVTGMDRQEATERSEALAVRLRVAAALAERIQAQRAAFGRLEEVHWDEDLGWHVVLQPDAASRATVLTQIPAVRAQLGHAPQERLDRVAATLQVLAFRHQTPDVIWADGDRTPDRVSVELLAERAPIAPATPGGRP